MSPTNIYGGLVTEILTEQEDTSHLSLHERCAAASTRFRGRSLTSQRPAASAIEACILTQLGDRDAGERPAGSQEPVVTRIAPRTRVSDEARSWYVGAQGELRVARLLEKLGPDWLVLHSVPIGTRNSDIDHVVIGPAGVFTINTKHHRGATVWVGEHLVMVNGAKTKHIRNSRFESERVSALLASEAVTKEIVRSLIVLVGVDRITFKQEPEGVKLLKDSELVRWLKSQPEIWTPAKTEFIAQTLADSALWATDWAPVSNERFEDFDALVLRPASLARATRPAPSSGPLARSSRPARQASRSGARKSKSKHSLLYDFIRLIALIGGGWWLLQFWQNNFG